MPRPNFFCHIDVINFLGNMELDGDYKDLDLTVDLIEIPYYLVYTSDEENWTVRVMNRGEIYDHGDDGVEAGSVVINKSTGEGKVTASPEMSKAMPSFFIICKNLSCFVQEKKMEPLYMDLDPEEAGIMLSLECDEITYKVVSGKERPEMMCNTLFGDPVMCRPYRQEFFESFSREVMSLEEKIEAAENGDVECMNELALLYLNGDEETNADPEKAVYWMRRMAEEGNEVGMFNLGLHYAKGFGVERDFEKALYWMEQAEEAGDEDAPRLIEDFRKILGNMDKAVAGDAQAQADLAVGFMKLGRSLKQAGEGSDYAESLKWAQKAADQGNGDGMWTLALAYEHGRGIEQDTDKAIEWYTKGAEIGHARSMNSLGCYYLRDEVDGKTEEDGFTLVKKAAEIGDTDAMKTLGYCYQFEKGTDFDMKKAIYWYEKYLEFCYDEELAQKVEVFKMMPDLPDFDEIK